MLVVLLSIFRFYYYTVSSARTARLKRRGWSFSFTFDESRDTGGASDRQQSKGNYEEEGHEEQAGQQHHLPLLIEVKPGNVPPVVERRHLQENTFASKRAQSLVREHIL